MKQITILTENHPGIVTEISEALAAANINIDSIDAESLDESAIIILMVDQYDEALQIINQNTNVKALTEDVLLVRINDQPGALAQIVRKFTDANINLRSIRTIQRHKNESFVAICTERSSEAMKLVDDILIS